MSVKVAPEVSGGSMASAAGESLHFIHDAMAHVQRLKIEVQNLKDALDTSQKIANRYSLLGVFDHRQ